MLLNRLSEKKEDLSTCFFFCIFVNGFYVFFENHVLDESCENIKGCSSNEVSLLEHVFLLDAFLIPIKDSSMMKICQVHVKNSPPIRNPSTGGVLSLSTRRQLSKNKFLCCYVK